MDTLFVSSKNSKTSDPQRLLLKFADKIALKRSDEYVTLSNVNIKTSYKNEFKISTLTWN